MIVIKGNLIINENRDKLRIGSLLRQAQNRISSETSSEQIRDSKEIVALADITQYDTTNATIIEGDIELSYDDLDQLTVVTGEVAEGGEYESTACY